MRVRTQRGHWSVSGDGAPDLKGRIWSALSRRGLLSVASALAVTGCTNKQHFYQIRLTFHLVTASGPVSYSGVWAASRGEVSAFPNPGSNGTSSLAGEAIAMPLENGRVIFALMASDDGARPPKGATSLYGWNPSFAVSRSLGVDAVLAGTSAVAPLAPSEMPSLVTFSDLNDPASGIWLHPADLSPACAQCRLAGVDIQVVRDAPTIGASKYLPWIGPPPKEYIAWDDYRNHPEYFVRKMPAW